MFEAQESTKPTVDKNTNEGKTKEVKKGDNKSLIAENLNPKRQHTKTNKYTKTKKNAAEKTVEQNVFIETTKTTRESRAASNKKKTARKPKTIRPSERPRVVNLPLRESRKSYGDTI